MNLNPESQVRSEKKKDLLLSKISILFCLFQFVIFGHVLI